MSNENEGSAMTDEQIKELIGLAGMVTGDNQLRRDGYYYRSLGVPTNVRETDLIRLVRAALLAAAPRPAQPESASTAFDKQQMDAMVNRFLGWKLPPTFGPDCYITFDREKAKANHGWPIGTNLLTADEARAMLEYVLDVTFIPDWSLLKATQASLREHMAIAKELRSELESRPALATPAAQTAASEVYGWLIENGKQQGEGLAYRYIDNDAGGIPAWTANPNKALRFARREDAEQYAHHDEDAWRIVEHGWLAASPAAPGGLTGLLRQAKEAMQLASSSYGTMLLSDPPQDAWKARGVHSKLAAAVAAIDAALASPSEAPAASDSERITPAHTCANAGTSAGACKTHCGDRVRCWGTQP